MRYYRQKNEIFSSPAGLGHGKYRTFPPVRPVRHRLSYNRAVPEDTFAGVSRDVLLLTSPVCN
ncbi:MAG: hypothetical protein ACFFD4_17890 [Candidatus Odinarchaeota archaeon]